ncbi:MAG: hypothetical protein WBO29_16830 [Albidovulum sp.]
MVGRFALWTLLVLIATGASAKAPSGFVEARNQGVSPTIKGKTVTFRLRAGQCQSRDYDDGRGESDCKNGNSRSQINSKTHQSLDHEYSYSFDFRLVAPFSYNGKGWGKVNYRSRLLISEWQRINTIKNHMYEMHLDTVRGVTFEGKVCIRPRDLAQWNHVEVKVRWSANPDGFMQVACNGKVIYATRGQNAIPAECGTDQKLQCAPKYQDLSKPIQWQLGPVLQGHGMNYGNFGFPSPFPPFPENGIELEMRDVGYRQLRQ